LDKALEFGATDTVEARDNTAADVLELTGGMGVDVKIEAVGYPATLLKMVASGRNPGGEDWALIRSPRPDGRGVRRVQERRQNSTLKVVITPARSRPAINPPSVLVAVTTKTGERS
jgi:hypothetical protein